MNSDTEEAFDHELCVCGEGISDEVLWTIATNQETVCSSRRVQEASSKPDNKQHRPDRTFNQKSKEDRSSRGALGIWMVDCSSRTAFRCGSSNNAMLRSARSVFRRDSGPGT